MTMTLSAISAKSSLTLGRGDGGQGSVPACRSRVCPTGPDKPLKRSTKNVLRTAPSETEPAARLLSGTWRRLRRDRSSGLHHVLLSHEKTRFVPLVNGEPALSTTGPRARSNRQRLFLCI